MGISASSLSSAYRLTPHPAALGYSILAFLVRNLLLAISTALAMGGETSFAAQEAYKIKVDVDLVTTDVTVVGAPAAELGAEDFIIYDNDVTQKVSHFSRDQIPLAVAIVIDRSLSVQKYMPILQITAVSSLRRLKPEDQVALFAFDYSVQKLSDLTGDRFMIAEKIGKIKNRLGTNIYDAIHNAANYLKKHAPQRRRAVILITDNIRMGAGSYNAQGALDELLESAATLYNIKTPADFGPPMYWEANERSLLETDREIRNMAGETGGEVVDMQKGISIQAALEKVISNLRLQYTIGFNPSNPGENGSFHRLSVKLASEDRCPRCRLLTRKGYYSGISAPLPGLTGAEKAPRATGRTTESRLIQQNILTAGSVGLEMTDIPFEVRTSEEAGPDGSSRIKADLRIDFSKIVFKPVDDRQVCKVHITVFYADSKGKVLGSEWRILEGALKKVTFQQAVKSGASFSISVPRKVPGQILKIVVYDEQSDRIGSKLVKLR